MPNLLEIQFYVYENMKQMVLPSPGPCCEMAQPTTLQTVCFFTASSHNNVHFMILFNLSNLYFYF